MNNRGSVILSANKPEVFFNQDLRGFQDLDSATFTLLFTLNECGSLMLEEYTKHTFSIILFPQTFGQIVPSSHFIVSQQLFLSTSWPPDPKNTPTTPIPLSHFAFLQNSVNT